MRSTPSALSALRRESTLLSVLASLALALKLIVVAVGLPATASGTEVICSSSGNGPVERSDTPLHGGDVCLCGPACVHLASSSASLAPSFSTPVELPTLASVAAFVPGDGASLSSPVRFGKLGSRAPPFA